MPGDGVIDDDATLTKKVKRVSRHKEEEEEEEEKEQERQDGDRLQINL